MPARPLAISTLLIAGLTAACGTPGAPQPPSLQLPRRVSDLAAFRQANKVTLTWTPPRQTTDGQNIRRPGPTLVCRSFSPGPMKECSRLAVLPASLNQSERAEYADTLPPEVVTRNPTGFASYAVEVQNADGRSAGLSNQVQVSLAPTVPPPSDFKAEVSATGVQLSWSAAEAPTTASLRYVYRVYRRTPGADAEAVIGEVPLPAPGHASVLDQSFDWGQTYLYLVNVVTLVPSAAGGSVEVEGADSPVLQITPRDTFPPEVPRGLEAVFSGPGQKPFIDLTWTPNSDRDLAGYNVYRQSNGQPPTRINSELVTAPAFRDTNVQPGATYQYFVSAVDQRGNQSALSAPASETVPAGNERSP